MWSNQGPHCLHKIQRALLLDHICLMCEKDKHYRRASENNNHYLNSSMEPHCRLLLDPIITFYLVLVPSCQWRSQGVQGVLKPPYHLCFHGSPPTNFVEEEKVRRKFWGERRRNERRDEEEENESPLDPAPPLYPVTHDLIISRRKPIHRLPSTESNNRGLQKRSPMLGTELIKKEKNRERKI